MKTAFCASRRQVNLMMFVDVLKIVVGFKGKSDEHDSVEVVIVC